MMKVQLAEWGNSLAVRLPKNVLEAARLHAGDRLDLRVGPGGELILQPAKRRYDLAELLAGVTPENSHNEQDWGDPVGGEVW